jgi:hypothetical protein
MISMRTTIAEQIIITAVALGHLPLFAFIALGVGLCALLWLAQDPGRTQRASDLLTLLFDRRRGGGDPEK